MSNTADPIVFYQIIRDSLHMDEGKTCEQIGHLVQQVFLKYFKIQILHSSKELRITVSEEDWLHAKMLEDWMNNYGSNKITVYASEEQWQQIKQEHKCVFTVSNGIEKGAETVMGLWPCYKSVFSKIIRELPTQPSDKKALEAEVPHN